jgi:hypothetical protein
LLTRLEIELVGITQHDYDKKARQSKEQQAEIAAPH